MSGDGSRVVGGTFFHSYGGSSRSAQFTAKSTASSSNGTFGTYCYDQTGKQLWKDEFTGFEGVYWVDISKDGAYAASGGWMTGSPNYAGFVRAFDVSTGTKVLDYATTSRVSQVALTADGGWLISAAESLVLFKRVNGVYQKTGEFTPPGTNPTVVTAAISADGNMIVYADYSGNVVLLANEGGLLALWKQWKLPASSSHCVRITPDGKAFAAGGSEGYFYFFDTQTFLQTGQPTITSQISSKSAVYGVAIADDASAFVGISNLNSTAVGGLVYFVPTASNPTGAPSWTYQTARNPNCASINLANGLLAVADGHPDGAPGNFYLLNTSTGAQIWQYGTTNMSWPIMISASGNAVVAGSDDSNMYYFTPAAP
ncbi:hypothetical protein CMV30_13310 [Nibricoccus aquaticus]|uniref:Pyrrolo-quinoline quinone n=1 Tax=Nibricoccus aquaticus TaxID=2576891 RepID=A0A290QF19_9BACT|nr:WD40 repeat domain-containing protein [Nibricoccus aquaticus]ATC64866.1 hypothetical protein CMV30_13310 [Nibricoccus aquaticus]